MTGPQIEPRSFQAVGGQSRVGALQDAVASRALIHRVRWHTGLSQAEFATTFRIDPEHLRDLESGLAQPDSALVAYLSVIDRAPEVVRAALTTC